MKPLFTRLLLSLTPFETSVLIFISFVLFYTMYDKFSGRLVPSNLLRLLTFQEGVDKFLVEMNKALSLSGLTVLAFSFFPIYKKRVRYALLWNAVVQLWVHAVYSTFKYYGSKNIPRISTFLDWSSEAIKKISIFLGIVAQLVLSLGYFSYINWFQLSLFGLSTSVLHFYTMEIDHKYVLRVRPYAFIVFPLSLIAFVFGCKLL